MISLPSASYSVIVDWSNGPLSTAPDILEVFEVVVLLPPQPTSKPAVITDNPIILNILFFLILNPLNLL